MNKLIGMIFIHWMLLAAIPAYSACIKGKVLNPQNEPVEAASVALFSKDSVCLEKTAANPKGEFELCTEKPR